MNLNVEYIYSAIDRMSPAVKRMSSNFNSSMKGIASSARHYLSVAKDKLKGFTSDIRQTGRSMMDFGKQMKWVSAGAGVGVWKTLKESMNFEDSQIMFETLIGSAEKGKKLINDIDVMAKKTPMGNKVLRETSQLMLSYGINVKNIMPSLKMLGDVSGGNTERFKRLAYAFSQVSAMGRLQGQDLRQMTEAGFNPLQIISEKTGYSMARLKEEMEAGNISFKMVQRAMKDATSEGGRFYGLMEKRNKSAMGALDEMLDTFNQVARGIGDTLKPAFESVTRKMTKFLEWFKNASPWLQKLVGWVLVLTAVMAPLTIALGGLAIAVSFISFPLLAIVSAVALVVAGFMYWKEIILGLDSLIQNFIDDIKTVGEWIGKLAFWKKDLNDEEMLEVNKNIKGIGGDSKFDINNLLTIDNKNNSEINYSPIKATGAGQSMAYGT